MKLIIQIPCYNEESTIARTFRDLPKQIDGIDVIETLIIDDGSTDQTVAVAMKEGVTHIVSNKQNMGLAKSFREGIEACLSLGADIIVNTDGDNQYSGKDVDKLVKPILFGEADIVVGDRQTDSIKHFSIMKKLMQKMGSGVVRRLTGLEVRDAVSGFRAISKGAAIRLNIFSRFSYTIEMLIQAARKDMKIVSVPVDINEKTRESRLFKNSFDFIGRQVTTLIRMYSMYQPLKVFFYLGTLFSIIGLIPILRFTYFYFTSGGSGHLQSLILGGVFLLMGFVTYLFGLLADLISFNRQLSEKALEKIIKLELDRKSTESQSNKSKD